MVKYLTRYYFHATLSHEIGSRASLYPRKFSEHISAFVSRFRRPFVFMSLQNPFLATPLFSHPYKTPGMYHHSIRKGQKVTQQTANPNFINNSSRCTRGHAPAAVYTRMSNL
jgi:hypothetical protein